MTWKKPAAMLPATLRRLERNSAACRDLTRYAGRPIDYARDVLHVTLWHKQAEALESLHQDPFRTLVSSGHDVGKTFTGAVAASYWFDVFEPGIVLTTAPKLQQVKDLLWKEVRSQRKRVGLGGFTGPKSLRLERSPRHFAKGETAAIDAGFQGQHEANVLVVIDEAEGVAGPIWDAANTMASGPGNAILAFYNPTTNSSRAAVEERSTTPDGKPTWRRITMSSLDHPNVAADLAGRPVPVPSAVRVAKVNTWFQDWSSPLQPGDDRKPTDLEWPPTSGKWWRPGPAFYGRVLGVRPPSGTDSVWSEQAFEKAAQTTLPALGPVQIGCDVARYGDDDTAFHGRRGGVSVHHEAAHGWNTTQVVVRCKELATELGRRYGVDPKRVTIAIDDCGVGGGVTDALQADGWNVVGVNVGTAAPDDTKHPNLRSALWCGLAEVAARGHVSFAMLPWNQRETLRREFLAPVYHVDVRGRKCVESKQDTKARLKRSPDNADACLLAYANVSWVPDRVSGRISVPR